MAARTTGKTGTSQQGRDAWFIGYTADQVAGVWFGNDDASPMVGAQGGGISARTWASYMKSVHRGRPMTDLAGGRPAPIGRPVQTAAGTSQEQIEIRRFYTSLSELFRQTHRAQLNPGPGFRRGGQTLRR